MMDPSVSDPQANPVAGAPSSYRVIFSKELLSGSRTHWRWKGEGSLTLGAGTLTLSGRRARPFGFTAAQAATFQVDQVRDVQCVGTNLRCVVDLPNWTPEPLAMAFESEADAQRVAAQLPATISQELQEQRAFAEQLSATGVRPLATYVLIVLCVLVFVILGINGISIMEPSGQEMIAWGTNFGPRTLQGEPWRLVSSLFLHFGLVHLALNMLSLWNVGRLVEQLLGTGRYVALYLGAGIAGSITSLIWNPLVNSAGASGAIFGVMGALLALMIHKKARIPVTVAKSLRSSTLLFIAFNVFYGFSHAGIDNAAHMGGLVGGFALGWLLARPVGSEPEPGPDKTLWITAVLAAALLAGGFSVLKQRVGGRVAVLEALQHIFTLESDTLKLAEELTQSRDSNQITSRAWARQLRDKVTPRWMEASDLARALDGKATESQRQLIKDVQHYLELRILQSRLSAASVLDAAPGTDSHLEVVEQQLSALIPKVRDEVNEAYR